MGLVVKDLFKQYGNKVVVDHISFELPKPGVYALLGSNGAGKSTTIRMTLGMLERTGGEVSWNGGPLNFDTCNIGYLAEERGLYPKYTLMDQIRYFGELRGVTGNVLTDRIAALAERLKVEEYLYPEKAAQIETAAGVRVEAEQGKKSSFSSKKPKARTADMLSKGNQQKIQFLIALLSDPELIVLDEPFSGLDPVNADILKDVVREQIAAGKYIIMSSHQMEVVEEFCTDITILHRSKVVVSGNLNDIKKSYGRVNLILKTEQNVSNEIRAVGAEILTEKENEYRIRVTGDDQAHQLLKRLMEKDVPIVKYDLSELSLHEIFVREVGDEASESK